MSVDKIIRQGGWCGLEKVQVPAQGRRASIRLVCMQMVLHDGPHEDGGTHEQWEAEMTEEDLAVPIAIVGGAVEDEYLIDPRARARGERPPTKQRPGDQVLPSGDESLVDDQQLVIDDIEKRRQVGIERYGQGHRPFNGRDTLEDLYEEQLDLLVYLRSIKRMAEASREEVVAAIAAELKSTTGFQYIVVDALAEAIYVRLQGWIAANIMKENRA